MELLATPLARGISPGVETALAVAPGYSERGLQPKVLAPASNWHGPFWQGMASVVSAVGNRRQGGFRGEGELELVLPTSIGMVSYFGDDLV
jgi:hypothetical protein